MLLPRLPVPLEEGRASWPALQAHGSPLPGLPDRRGRPPRRRDRGARVYRGTYRPEGRRMNLSLYRLRAGERRAVSMEEARRDVASSCPALVPWTWIGLLFS